MARLDFSEYYKPKTNKAPSQRYYEPPKPKSVPKRQQLPPVFDEFANPYPSPGVEYVKPNVPPIYKNFTVPANAYQGDMYPVTDSYEYPYAAPEPKFDFPKIGAPTDPWGGWRALQNWSSSTVSGMQNSAANMITSIGRYFQERSKPPFSYTDQQPYKQYLPIVSTPWATQPNLTAGDNPGQRSSPTFVPTTRMSDDRAWQNSRARTGDAIRPQDYFMRTVLNGIGYSIPNQMLNFTDTGGVSADWAQTPRWYEPPAGYTTSGAGWKESIGKPWGLQDVTDGGTFEPYGEGGGGGGGGWGGGDYYSLPSMPDYRGYADGGYYSMPGSPNYKGYSGGGIRMPGSPQYTGRNSSGYGASSNVSGYANAVGAGGYGSNGNAPSYVGRGAGGRASSYVGAQSANQASWRMPMLVWNI